MDKFPGFPRDPATNYWPYPKALNGWWHVLSGSEQKALDYILRHTWGFKKNADFISYSQFINGVKNCDKGCGIGGKATLSRALTGLEEKGFIRRDRFQHQAVRYTLTFTEASSDSALPHKTSSKSKQASAKSKPASSKMEHTIKDISIKDINNKYTYKNINYLREIPKEDIKNFTEDYKITEKQLLSKCDDLIDYCKAHGKRYKDYRAFLRNAVKKEFGKRPETKYIPPKYEDVPDEVKKQNLSRMVKLRETVSKIKGVKINGN